MTKKPPNGVGLKMIQSTRNEAIDVKVNFPTSCSIGLLEVWSFNGASEQDYPLAEAFQALLRGFIETKLL